MTSSEKVLKKLGLSNREIAIYLAGIKTGPSLASQIAKQANISRTLTYHLLKLLENKGIMP